MIGTDREVVPPRIDTVEMLALYPADTFSRQRFGARLPVDPERCAGGSQFREFVARPEPLAPLSANRSGPHA